MRPGRKPKPTQLKLLAGNPGHRPLNDAEPEAPVGRPSPDFLDEVAGDEWDRICDLLERMGLLSMADRTVITAYCVIYSRWVEAERMVKKSGTIVKSPNKESAIMSPYLCVANRAMEQMLKLCVELGLSPSARSRIHIPPGAKKDKFSRFLENNERA